MIHQTHTLLLVHTKRQAAEIRLRHADVPRFKWTHSDQLDTINIFFVHSFLKYFKFPNGKVSRLEGHSATRPLPAGAATHTPSLPAAATATAPRLPPQSQGPLLRAGARAASRLRDGALSRRRGCGGAAALREGPGSGPGPGNCDATGSEALPDARARASGDSEGAVRCWPRFEFGTASGRLRARKTPAGAGAAAGPDGLRASAPRHPPPP